MDLEPLSQDQVKLFEDFLHDILRPEGDCSLTIVELVDWQLTRLAEVKKVIHAKESALRTIKNESSSLYKFPSEVLENILLHSMGPYDEWRAKRLRKLSQVCKWWYNTIAITPAFWQVIHSEDSEGDRSFILTKYPTRPLKMICSSLTAPHRGESFLIKMKEHSPRWESVLILDTYPTSIVRHLSIPTPTPILADLYIKIHDEEESAAKPPILLGDGRNLRDVDLDGARLDWNLDRLSQLRSLKLCGLVDDLPAVSQILAILLASPELELLLFINLTIQADEYAQEDPTLLGVSIQLAQLRTFCLSNVPYALIDFLTSSIIAPRCQYYNVQDILPLPTNLLPVADMIAPMLQSEARVTLNVFSDKQITISNMSETVPSNWAFEPNDAAGCVMGFRRMEPIQNYLADLGFWFTDLAIPNLRMELHQVPSSTAHELLDRFPHLKELQLEKTADILPYLTKVSDAGTFRCPSLIHLDVPEASKEEVIQFLKARKAVFGDQSPASAQPARLETLHAAYKVVHAVCMEGLGKGLNCITLT